MIDLRQLQHFVVLSEELHFRRAAERLFMTQPPLTHSIQAMERELGVDLFSRSRRHVALTKAGEALLVEARATLERSSRLVEVAKRAARGEVGTLRIGFSISASFARPFTRALRTFALAYPDIALELTRTTATIGLNALRQGALDICITRPFHPIQLPSNLQHTIIQRDRLMLILHADHPLATRVSLPLKAIASEPFIFYQKEQGTAIYQQVMDLWEAAGLMPEVARELGDGPTIMSFVAAGLGVSVLPSSLQVIKFDDIVWRKVEANSRLTESAVAVVYPKVQPMGLPQTIFLETLNRFAHTSPDSLLGTT